MAQPHIVLITCDELRRDALSCYGGQAVQTPHLDALAARGVRFDRAYTVSPLCLPARCSLLTGLYPHRSGAYSNFRKCALDVGVPNLFQQLRGAGYHTGLVGKCHFAPVDYAATRPDVTLPYDGFPEYYRSLGLDTLILQDDKQVSIWYYDDYSRELDAHGYLKPYRDCNWDEELRKVYPFPAPAQWHPDAWVGRKAAEHLAARDAETPSFTWVSFSGPHYPFDTPAEYRSRVNEAALPGKDLLPGELEGEDRILHTAYYGGGHMDGCHAAVDKACKNYTDEYWHELQAQYYGNVALIDDQVGAVLAAARQRFGENVLVIFTCDHGEMLGHHGVWGKHDCGYDDVWRLPFLMAGPGVAAGVSEAIINLNDILPTCLQAAGKLAQPCDGRPLSEQMATGGYDYTFAESESFIAVTDGRFKLIHLQHDVVMDEFWDTQVDPEERQNRLTDPAYAADLARLRGKLIDHVMDKVLP